MLMCELALCNIKLRLLFSQPIFRILVQVRPGPHVFHRRMLRRIAVIILMDTGL